MKLKESKQNLIQNKITNKRQIIIYWIKKKRTKRTNKKKRKPEKANESYKVGGVWMMKE